MSLHLLKRIKDRLKLANELRQRGYEVPHSDSDAPVNAGSGHRRICRILQTRPRRAYDTTVATLLTDQALYQSVNDHFEPTLGDVGASNQYSAPAGPGFSGGGGMSGGGS